MCFKLGIVSVVVLLVLIVGAVRSEDPDKWVWSGDGSRNARLDDGGAVRYEVFENGDDFQRPGRPIFGTQGSGPANGPYKPGQGLYNPQRPQGIYGQGGFRPPKPVNSGGSFGLGSGGFDGQILTGPSYGKDRPFKYFDTCKCTERFNCNSYGVAYGHCDVGKQYCCYASKSGPPPNRPIHSAENGILVGPGGPHDRPQNTNLYDGANGVLVGPGGPTGIIGKPPRPIGSLNRPSNGVLIGPGGPFDRPYNNVGSLYGRSSRNS